MAGEEDDNEILQLQSETIRRQDIVDRIKLKCEAIESELLIRNAELEKMREQIASQQHQANKAPESADLREDQAVSRYMEEQVRELLGSRIPALRPGSEGVGKGGHDLKQPPEERQEDSSKHHDTVLLKYVDVIGEKLQLYCAPYRIGNETAMEMTVEMLHRDACAYWGCLHTDYVLVKITENKQHIELSNDFKNCKLQKGEIEFQETSYPILNPKHEAILYLIKQNDLGQKDEPARLIERIERKESEDKMQSNQKEEIDKTVQGAQEATTEPFVEALRLWPGLYWLLKKRQKKRVNTFELVKMRDIVIFLLLAIMSAACVGLRRVDDAFIVVQAVERCLDKGVHLETSTPGIQVPEFSSIQVYEDIWLWLQGGFHYQLFNNRSSLRKAFTPHGFLRLRQQRVRVKPKCARMFPPYLSEPCPYVHVSKSTEERQDLIFNDPGIAFQNRNYPGSGRLAHPKPNAWQPRRNDTADLRGKIQSVYDGSGYMVEYSLKPQNISVTAVTFKEDLPFFGETWLNEYTRLFAVEFTLANYNVGSFLYCSFFFEFAPSGAIASSHVIQPFHISSNSKRQIANYLEYPKAFLILVYLFLVRTYLEIKSELDKKNTMFHYLFSFLGIVDMSTVALEVVILLFRLQDAPPQPKDLQAFYSYSNDASISELLHCMEATLLLLLIVRLTSFMVVIQFIYQLWQTFRCAITMAAVYLVIFVPTLMGAMFFASGVWFQTTHAFSTPLETLISILHALQGSLPVQELAERSRVWTVVYMIFFLCVVVHFFLNMFIAIAVHAYWQVHILFGRNPALDTYNRDETLDWMLWGPVYHRITQKEPGSHFRQDKDVRVKQDGEDEDEEEEEEDNVDEKKVQ